MEKTDCLSQLNSSCYVKVVQLEMFGDKLFACSICDSVFNSASMLSHHQTRTHGSRYKRDITTCAVKHISIETLCSGSEGKKVEATIASSSRKGSSWSKNACKSAERNQPMNTSPVVKLVNLGEVSGKKFVCSFCDGIFSSFAGLSLHISWMHTRDNSSKSHRFKQQGELSDRRVSVKQKGGGQGKFTCQICKFKCKSRLGLTKHKAVHTEKVRSFTCSKCGAKRMTAGRLKRHMATSCKQNHRCKECGMQLGSLQAFKHHVTMHTGEKTHFCLQCPARFKLLNGLTLHMRSHSGLRPFSCDQCDATFRQSAHLRTHKLMHAGLKLYPCKVCGKKFGQSSHRNTHMKIHGEKKCVCLVCGDKFHLSHTLRLHMRLHLNQKPYSCSKCPEKFTQLVSLKDHERKHLGLKYSCEVCGGQYSNHHGLRTHMAQVHLKHRHACSKCPSSYTALTHLKMHEGQKHGGPLFSCQVCDRPYTSGAGLKRHMAAKHVL